MMWSEFGTKSTDIKRIHGKSAKYIYVDETPTFVKIQIS